MDMAWLQENGYFFAGILVILGGLSESFWGMARVRLFDYIKEKHPEHWKLLGYPRTSRSIGLFHTWGPLEKSKIQPFLRTGYRDLKDERINRLVYRMKFFRFLEGLLILIGVILFTILLST